jgi:CRISPR-associated protein Cmr6
MTENNNSALRYAIKYKLNDKSSNKYANARLLLSSYIEKTGPSEAKTTLFRDTIKSLDNVLEFYKKAFENRQMELEKSKHLLKSVYTPEYQRLVIGLGNSSVLETGLTLHSLYGTPMIPSSALKGLCAHHAREKFFKWDIEHKKWQIKDSDVFNEDQYAFIFGNTTQPGRIHFHDAWIKPDKLKESLHCDVMTPHHQAYYNNGSAPPTDFDTPVPVSFLSITGTFDIILTCNAETNPAWLETTWVILDAALENRGIGGKTSSGYGRMNEVKDRKE